MLLKMMVAFHDHFLSDGKKKHPSWSKIHSHIALFYNEAVDLNIPQIEQGGIILLFVD